MEGRKSNTPLPTLRRFIDKGTFELCFTEATNSILKWMNISDSMALKIRSSIPPFVRTEPMEIYFSSGPAAREYDMRYPMWLRNTFIVDYPENKYHIHLKGEAGMGYDSMRFEEFVDKRFTYVPLYSGDGEPDSTSPAIAIIRDDESDPDKALHIFHIIVGAFVVHLVGKKDVQHFDRLAHELMEAEWGLLFKAGHIQLLADWKSL